MRNDDFRKLVSSTPVRQDDRSPSTKAPALGAKRSSFVPMTPRPGKAPSGNDFARQVREQHASLQPTKKFKSSVPKGSKFAAGYTDRAKARLEAEKDEAEDDKAKRIKALEEQVKLGQLAQDTFEALRDEILGGDISNTHLVKGLDRRLLERVRQGEDVFSGGSSSKTEEPQLDIDEELDRLEEKEVETIEKEKMEKKGTMAPPAVAGVKRTRDEIMAELKAQRKAAAIAKAATAPALDSRWKKVGSQAKPKIEIDRKGREVQITVDEDGNVKKRVRKAPLDMPDAAKPVLGADVHVPEPAPPPIEDDEDEDIFADAGTDYNPLGEAEDDDDDENDEDDDLGRVAKVQNAEPLSKADPASDKSAITKEAIRAPRNYFEDTKNAPEETERDRFEGIENVLKKAAKLESTAVAEDNRSEDETKETHEARLAKHTKMLQQDRDFEDMDMGFGSSRLEDEEEGGDGKKVRLSHWTGNGGDDGWEDGQRESGKKKRKPKKRKGDVNNAADIMRVIEGRKAGGK